MTEPGPGSPEADAASGDLPPGASNGPGPGGTTGPEPDPEPGPATGAITGPATGATTGPAPSPDPSPPDLEERVVETRTVHRGKYLELRVQTVQRADGSRATRDVVGHPGAVAIVAVDPEGSVLLVRQYRVPAGRALLEIPAGTLDVDEATGRTEDPDLAARRELEEETGYRAGSWDKLAEFWTAPGFATELMHLYLAVDLEPADADRLGPEEDERLELVRLPVDEAIAAVDRGEIADAKSLVGLLLLARRRPTATDNHPTGTDASTRGNR